MSLFKKTLPSKVVATFLMDYTLVGNTDQHDAHTFAMGPLGLSATDGSNVLPDGEIRSHEKHLSSRDKLIIELEKLYLRGSVVHMSVQLLVKNARIRETMMSEYDSIWKQWSTNYKFEYFDFYDKSRTIYGVELAFLTDNLTDQEKCKKVGLRYAELCDPFSVIVDPLRSELAEIGSGIFMNATAVIGNILESTFERFRITT